MGTTTTTNRNGRAMLGYTLRALRASRRIRISRRVVQMRYPIREERGRAGPSLRGPFASFVAPLPFSRRCRFNPFGRPLGVCMAMHYSSNNERAARIVAYLKEGNATILNVRFLRPRRGTPIHYIGSWALSRGPYWPYSWAPRDTARKYDVLIPVRSDAHGCSRIPCSSLLVLAFVTWGLALSQHRQLTWIADNPILSLPLSLRN